MKKMPCSWIVLASFVLSTGAFGQPAPKPPVLDGFVLIKGATFSRSGTTSRGDKQRVRVNAFEILDHPVTNREYKRFVDAAGHRKPLHWTNGRIPAGKENHPVIFVSRDDVSAFLDWASKRDGRVYRLPTGAEFEHAARGGREYSRYPWGDEPPSGKANYDPDGTRDFGHWQNHLRLAREGTPNGFGLYGMAGNVWQMVVANPEPATQRFKYRIENERLAEGPVTGGSWARGPEYLRCGYIVSVSAGSRQPDVGFRPVRSPDAANWAMQPRKLQAQPVGQGKVFLSWALLSSDPADVTFNVYWADNRDHDGFKVNDQPIAGSTCFIDTESDPGVRYQYYVTALDSAGIERSRSEWAGVTATAEAASVLVSFQPLYRQGGLVPVFGDLVGDRALDCVVRLDNGNSEMSQDPGLPVQIEAFTSYGRSLWRKDLMSHDHCYGNANNVPFNVWDMDADGKAEVITRLQIGDDDFVAILDGMTGRVEAKAPWPEMVSDFQRSSTRVHLSVVYLDGKRPAIVTQTGLYENELFVAFDASLKQLWKYESFAETNGSGGHKIEAADVDGDGKQEVFAGSMCLNPDGSLRWSIYRQHPDIISVHDYLPDRPGFEVFFLIESSMHAGAYMVDAKTGTIIWKVNREEDSRWNHGHIGWTADVWSGSPGLECVVNRRGHDDRNLVMFSADGRQLLEPFPFGYTPFEYDGDPTRELLGNQGKTVGDFDGKNVVPINGLNFAPAEDARLLMTADLYGDFRDELVYDVPNGRGGRAIAVVMVAHPTAARFVSRTEDLDYRLWLARNMGGGYRSVFDQPLVAPKGPPGTK